MEKFNIAVLVKNQEGVLNRVTSMFRRRQFNIDSLTVSETETEAYSRITVTFSGNKIEKDHLIAQLYKLPDVSKVKELNTNNSISCELLLIKMVNNPKSRDDIQAAATAFGAKTINYTKDAIIMKVTGTSDKIDSFIKLMRDYTILEICRTGVVSLEMGGDTINKEEV